MAAATESPRARERVARWLRPVFYLGHNAITLIGAVLTTSAALTLLGLLGHARSSRQGTTHPYAGIVVFLHSCPASSSSASP